jgi:tetratricopeptide (TPR) repeat protein
MAGWIRIQPVATRRYPVRLCVVLLLLAISGVQAEEGEDALRARLAGLVNTEGYWATLEAAEKALTEEPDSVAAWQYKAYSLQGLGRLAEARKAYEKTVALDPKNWWAHMNLGDVLASLESYDLAVQSGSMAVRLEPTQLATHAKLLWIYRRAGAFAEAVAAAKRALTKSIDPAFCHAELGYLHWVLEDADQSRKHWEAAREFGFDETACAHGIRLVEWDGRPSGSRSRRLETSERRAGEGREWKFSVGQIEVTTRLGPKLPRDLTRLLVDLQRDNGRFLGISGDWEQGIRLHLSRTLEEHERNRLRHFRLGPIDKAFLVRRPGWRGRRGPGGPRGAGGSSTPRWELDLYVALAEPGIERSLSHELVHAMLNVRAPDSMDTPTWFDEGLATYLELAPDRRGRPDSGTTRKDLLEVIVAARESGQLWRWSEMVNASSASFTGTTARIRYAQAWSMVHFLAEGYGRDSKKLLARYIDLLADRRTPARAAFEKVYGTNEAKLNGAWELHVEALE